MFIEEKSIKPLKKHRKNARRTKSEYYIENINLECWVLHKGRKPIDSIQPYLITNMSIDFRRGLALLYIHHNELLIIDC